MPRHPRIHAPGVLYHLIARGHKSQAMYLERADYEAFLNRQRYPFSLYAYVLMPDHFRAGEKARKGWRRADFVTGRSKK